jgi:hypothetical protein
MNKENQKPIRHEKAQNSQKLNKLLLAALYDVLAFLAPSRFRFWFGYEPV